MSGGHFIVTRVYPLSPNVALILRHNILMKEEAALKARSRPAGEGTMWHFKELPFEHTRVTYDPPPTQNAGDLFRPGPTALLEEQRKLETWLGGVPITSRSKDKLTFRCFTLSARHCRMVNSLILENCRERVIFMNLLPLYKTIRLGYDKDLELQHKVDYTKLKRKLVDAFRATQVTVGKEDEEQAGAAAAAAVQTSQYPLAANPTALPPTRRRKKKKTSKSQTSSKAAS